MCKLYAVNFYFITMSFIFLILHKHIDLVSNFFTNAVENISIYVNKTNEIKTIENDKKKYFIMLGVITSQVLLNRI